MTCEINLEGLYKMVKKRLDLSTGLVDPKQIASDIYNTIYDGVVRLNNDTDGAKDQAMAYARMVPTMIRQGLMGDFRLFNEATQNGFQFAELARMESSFTSDIKNVASELFTPASAVEELSVMQERVNEQVEKKEEFLKAGFFEREIDQQLGNFGKYAPTFFATTGAEFKGEPWKYRLQRKIVRLVNSNNADMRSGEYINLPGVGPVQLKLQKASDIEESQLDRTKTKDGSYELIYIPKPEDMAYVLVDSSGNTLYFDQETGELSSQETGGRIAYWYMYKPENFVEKTETGMRIKPFILGEATTDSQKEAKKQYQGVANHFSNIQFATDYKDLSPEAKAIIDEALESQLLFAQAAHDNVTEGQVVNYNIVGGSLGFISKDERDQDRKVPLRKIPYLTPEMVQVQTYNVEGSTYSALQLDGEPVRISVQPGIPEGYADTITSLLLDDNVYNNDGTPATDADRIEAIKAIANTGKTVQEKNGVKGFFRFFNSKLQVAKGKSGKLYVKLIPKNAPGGKYNLNAVPVDISGNPNMREMVKDYLMSAEFMHVNKKYTTNPGTFSVPYIEVLSDGDRVIRKQKVNYNQFIYENESFYIKAGQDPTGELMRSDSYFTVAPSPSSYIEIMQRNPFKTVTETAETVVEQGTDIQTAPTEIKPDKPNASNIQTEQGYDEFMNSPDVTWDKLNRQKTGNIPASKEEIEKARVWYESSPLKQHIPFRVMFNAVNSRNPNSVAEWSENGIVLYQGSDYSDLYHEAWHGFTQTFLTPAQRNSMYKELSKKKGTFRDYNGKLVEFAFASEKQLEEYLAETFREYMLSDGAKTDKSTPKTNNIFQKILNFLRELFGSTTLKDGVSSPRITKTVDELYQKLRVGNLDGFTFDANNRGYGVLFSTIRSLDDQDATRTKLNYQDTSLVVESMDSIFSQVMDDLNRSSRSGNTKRFSNTLFKSNRNKLNAYNAAYLKFKQIAAQIKSQIDALDPSQIDERNSLQYNLDLVNWTINNFGNLESIEENMRMQKGVIYSHIQKSRVLSNEDKEAATSDEKDTDDANKTREAGFDAGGQALSLKEMASKEILYIMRGLYKYDNKGQVELNSLGLPKLNDFDKSWNYFARNLQGTLNATDMYNKLQQLASDKNDDVPNRAMVVQLLNKLGTVTSNDYHSNHLWTNFWQTFNKTRIPLIQMTLTASKGKDYVDIGYQVTIGEAQSSSRQVVTNWENRFATTRTEFINERKVNIEREKRGQTENYLSIPKVLAKYPRFRDIAASPNLAYDFLADVGIMMSYRTPILDAIGKNLNIQQAVKHVYDTLVYLDNRRTEHVDPIRSVEDLFAEYDDREQAFNRLNDLRDLEAKYGDVVSSFMVSNAEGNTQFEHSLNSTMTVLVDAINNAKSFKELYSMPHMAHFDPARNPFVESSIWLKSIFQENPDGSLGMKRRDVNGDVVEIKLENLSGVKTIDEFGNEDGVATASSDPMTKFILDFHTSVLRGSPELPRHADKSSSFTAYVTDVLTGDENKVSRFKYVDDADFFINKSGNEIATEGFGSTRAFAQTTELLLPYVKAELRRIEAMKELSKTDVAYDRLYMAQGQKFNIFDDVFSTELKKKLIKAGSEGFMSLKPQISAALETYFTNLTDQNLRLQRRADYIDSNVTRVVNRQIRKKLKADKRYRVTNDSFRKNTMMSFVVNSWIHNLEAVTMIYGDLAMYNHKKEEFHKRNAGAGSTGELFRTDRNAITYVNSIGRGISRNEIGREKSMSYDGTFDSAVFEDTTTEAEFFKEYSDSITAYFKQRYRDPEVAKKKAAKVIEKYSKKETKEGDAQGWISFDSYRIMLTLQGKWSQEQENMYQKIVKGEVVDTEEVLQLFPVKKVQYWGPLQNFDGPPMMAFHKFSLMPLIPNVIKGTNLEKLHQRMMREDIDYALFKSGSKIGTITKGKNADRFYSDEDKRIFDTDGTLTKNTVFLHYMKDQLDTGDKFKGKITYPTQMRKLLIDGFMEVGVPVDFEPSLSDEERIRLWDNMATEKDRKNASPFYAKYRTYEEQVDALTKQKYNELLKKINFKEVNGRPVGDVRNLVNYIRTQFELQDLSDHEKEFIQASSTGGLKFDLSLSFSADKIEKLLNAIVVKELVKQKIKGEGLIQVSVAGWEKVGTSRELSTYHVKDGKVQPMQIKIALQGDFLKLLRLPKVKELVSQGMTELEALNSLLKDERWLSEGDNRKMVTITGTRIPVQGHNSMEFMQIAEFLPTNAGHIIIAPSELVSKSGGDFDIDKMFTMMPSIKTDKEKGAVYNNESIENKIISSQVDLLSTQENFVNLIRPNATDIFDDLASDLKEDVTEYNPMENQNPDDERTTMSPTRILELPYNIYKQNTNSVGKAVLGIGAVENTYNVLFNRIGMFMNPTNGLSMEQYYELRDWVEENRDKLKKPFKVTEIKGVRRKYSFKEINKIVKDFGRQVIAMPHNSRTVGGQKVISISNMYDANNEHRISDIISQMINGWVDVAKDPWIFNIQGNKEITPTLLYMIQAGVPVEQAVYFVSQPLVRQYVENQRANKSNFSGPLGTKPHNPNLVNYNAKRDILIKQVGVGFFNTTDKDSEGNEFTRTWYDKIDAFRKTEELVDPYMQDGFDPTELRTRIKSYNQRMKAGEAYQVDDFDRAAFLHFLELEEQAKALTQFKRTTNVDTSKQSTLFDARKKQMAIAELKQNGRIPVEMVDRIKEQTVIGSFFDVLEYQQEIWGPYFKIRDNEQLTNRITDIFSSNDGSDIVDYTFNGDYEKFAGEFRNDFMVYLFQKDLYGFDLKNLKEYKGYNAETAKPAVGVDFLEFGAVFKDGVLYVDRRQMKKDWESLGSVQKDIVAPVTRNMFNSPEEYYKFVVEREYIRSVYPLEVLRDTVFFKAKSDQNAYKMRDVDPAIAEAVNYEEVIKDMALTNNFNIRHIFKGQENMARKLMTVLKAHPELRDNYKVLDGLGVQKTGSTWNIKLVDRMLDGDKVELYHENMTDLMDPDKIRVNTDYANKKIIADFFSKFGTYSILQSGFNTNSVLSLQRIVNQDRFIVDAVRITQPYTRKNNPQQFDKELLDEYQTKFIFGVNKSTNSDRLRFKDYMRPVTRRTADIEQEAIDSEQAPKNKKMFAEDALGGIVYDIADASAEAVEAMVRDNPKVIFVFDDVTQPPAGTVSPLGGTYGNNFRKLVGKYPNVMGIPTRRTYSNQFSSAVIPDKLVGDTYVVDEGFKRLFDNSVKAITDKLAESPDYTVAFKVNGHGQKQINADDNDPSIIPLKQSSGVQTFKYISETLYRNFGFRNPNYSEKVPDAAEFITETQPITDEMVLDQIKFCYGLTT